jgi:hypothetical protein
VQLLIAIEKEKMTVGTYGVQFAVERRKKEMQLLPHYLPLFLGFMPSLAYISLATIFHVFPHNYLGWHFPSLWPVESGENILKSSH